MADLQNWGPVADGDIIKDPAGGSGGWVVVIATSGTVALEMSPDRGTTWVAAKDQSGNVVSVASGEASAAVPLPQGVWVRASGGGGYVQPGHATVRQR